jgi:Fe-S-cluster containining protein
MARARSAIGPLLDLNHGRIPHRDLQLLAAKIDRAGLRLSVLDETTRVDERGVVVRETALCGACQGKCCSSLKIPILVSDAKRLATHLGVRVRDLDLLPLEGDEDEPSRFAGYLSKGDRPCPHFNRGCSVHAARPDVCRTFGLADCTEAQTFTPLARVRRSRHEDR